MKQKSAKEVPTTAEPDFFMSSVQPNGGQLPLFITRSTAEMVDCGWQYRCVDLRCRVASHASVVDRQGVTERDRSKGWFAPGFDKVALRPEQINSFCQLVPLALGDGRGGGAFCLGARFVVNVGLALVLQPVHIPFGLREYHGSSYKRSENEWRSLL